MEEIQHQQELGENQGDQKNNDEAAIASEKDEKDYKSLLEEEQQKTKERDEEIERLKQDRLKAKTSPKYFERQRKNQELRRKAIILNNTLPNTHKYTPEQMNEMTPAELVRMMDEKRQLDENRVTQKFAALLESKDAENEAKRNAEADAEIKETQNAYPKEFRKYYDDIIRLDDANPEARLSAKQLLIMAATEKGDMEALGKIMGKKDAESQKKEVDAKKKEAKAGIGQSPATNATDTVKSVAKPMSAKEAAEKAYDEAFGS